MNPPAPAEELDRYAAVLVELAAQHGLSNLRHGGPGTVVVDVVPGGTYFDLAEFELAAEALVGYDLFALSARAPGAATVTGAPLKAAAAA